MVEIVYINEYQPSSATLKLSNNPIYKDSQETEKITVGVPISLWFLLPLLVGALTLVALEE